ncbi:glutathione S-transferase family protein [Rhodotorula paludigena]|uniref:glutathione S-transferase family protein n=1 Tax=Rhodotorula paludigena TaxID=86838 RepID=UPI003182B30A
MVQPLTIYSARVCPWAQRATLALCEVGAYKNNQVEHVEIDLQNKPDWYASKVNPASKVPVIRVGAEGDQDTVYIPESGVLLELVADLYSESGLSPKDPVKRAEARYYAQRFQDIVNAPLGQLLYQGKADAASSLFKGVSEWQQFLARYPGPFLLGEQVTIGDLAVAPFIGRLFSVAKAGLVPAEVNDKLTTDAEFEPFRAYHDALTSRASWKETFDEPYIVEKSKARIEALKKQQ